MAHLFGLRRFRHTEARIVEPFGVHLSRLDGGDGCALCDRLKHDAGTKEIPVLIVTAWALGGHVERAKKAGCDSVLLKPCPPATLLQEIKRLIKHS